jgi:multidrug efflux system membrane fusion protein
VNQARAQRAEAEASRDKARRDHERAERLYAAQSLTRPDYDGANAAFAVAEARAAAATAQLESAEIALRDSALAAPMDAVVLSRQIEAGTLAAPGTVAFVLADIKRVKAVFGVPDRMVPALKAGETLPVKTDGRDFIGQVTAIAPSADSQSRVFNVEVTIDNPARVLKPGMIATVVVKDDAPDAKVAQNPAVPLAAVVKSEEGAYAVFVVEGEGEASKARLRKVSLGDISGGQIRVSSGLKAQEPVIVSGATLLVDGEPVRVIP